MGAGAKLSKGRPKYCCLKAQDFKYFSVSAGLCLGHVFITRRTLLIVLDLAVFGGHYTVCRPSGMRAAN